jgi:hypothetical protein
MSFHDSAPDSSGEWKSHIDIRHPCWDGYRGLIEALPAEDFPGARALTRLLPPGTRSRGGFPIRFVPAGKLPGVQYERHIFETGEVSTRENSWHDLFNALVWCRLPRLKAVMNTLHYQGLGLEKDGRRGKMRDALTLLDESGVIVAGSDMAALEALARRDWNAAFVGRRAAWRDKLQVLVCGHAVLEKFLEPYKSVTAHAVLLHTPRMPPEEMDDLLASRLIEGRLFDTTGGLAPLPLMGVPGWWQLGAQDRSFYADHCVFRAAPMRLVPAPIHHVDRL